jgi:hypothetical protein
LVGSPSDLSERTRGTREKDDHVPGDGGRVSLLRGRSFPLGSERREDPLRTYWGGGCRYSAASLCCTYCLPALLPVVLVRSGGVLARRMTYPYVGSSLVRTRLIPIPLYSYGEGGPGGQSARQGPYTERHSRPFPSRFFLPVQADLVERRRERRKNFPAFVSWSAVIAKIRSRCY